jgi:hypothetical protein
MSRRPTLLVAAVALLAAGCPLRVPPPDLSLDPAQLLGQVQEAQGSIQRVQGETRVTVRAPQGAATIRQFVAAERPDRVHLEELDFFGNPAAVLVTSGGRFWLYDGRKQVLYRGAATPANLSRLVPIRLSAADLVAVLLGGAPALEHAAPTGVVQDHARLRLRLEGPGGREDLWVGEKALVEKAEVRRSDGGDYLVEFSPRQARGGGWFPAGVALHAPSAKIDVDLRWGEAEVNGELDPRLFEPPAPRGARVVDLGDGLEGT